MNNNTYINAIMEARCALLDVVQVELRHLRIILGCNSYELANMVGVSRMHYIRWENGMTPLTASYYPALAAALDQLIDEQDAVLIAQDLLDHSGCSANDPAFTTAFSDGSLRRRWEELTLSGEEQGEDIGDENVEDDVAEDAVLDADEPYGEEIVCEDTSDTDEYAEPDEYAEADAVNDLLYGRRIIADESALCADGAEHCIDLLRDAYITEDNALFVPVDTIDHLEQRAQNGDESAQRAIVLLKRMNREKLLNGWDDSCDGDLLTLLAKGRMKRDLCLLTQDEALAQQVYKLNGGLFDGDITVGRIEKNGKPSAFCPENSCGSFSEMSESFSGEREEQ